MSNDLTSDEVRELLHYDPLTGNFFWTDAPENGKKAGRKVGTVAANGYVMIRVLGKPRLAHRLAWLLHYGSWPTFNLDHINRNKSDNRIENLRDVPQKANAFNARHKPKVVGPFQDGERWKFSYLYGGEIEVWWEDYATKDEAGKAYEERQKQIKYPYRKRPKIRATVRNSG